MLPTVIIIIFIILLIVICTTTPKCDSCNNEYEKCMQDARGNLQKLDHCSSVFCSEKCQKCGKSAVDCKSPSHQCDQHSVPDSCLVADNDRIYFTDKMCAEDIEEVCKDPDVRKQLCKPNGQFSANGKTPCCAVCNNIKREEYFDTQNTTPPFLYPADIQQPAGSKGWGYRDPQATYQTLLWEQSRPALLMPHFNQPQPVGYIDMSVPSAPVPVKHNACPSIRPPRQLIVQQPVAQSNYANW